ncbi:RNA polymerase sigma factor [Pedobacter frigoris]|uniref:RNA polymerase sigma-70 factor n=1 Tax=Pedobacter frigoris TaxID=2571272 RepID=A0A4U1CBF1_9SPHI|nr:RNA polymerase sigma-70 factor [Pedobacter frigoris]TKC03927.1 RNA polymerase sigma-70 factor [Pedobacter frigoris]
MDKNIPAIDFEMLIKLKAGDNAAFDFFYKQYRARIYSNILKMLKSPELASDVLQEVFVSLWNNRNSIDPEQSFDNYILRIAQNKVYDFFRKASRDKKLAEKLIALSVGDEYNPIEEGLHLKWNLSLLEKEIELLPPKCREVFKLCKVEGKSYNEVAELLNISTATVNNHIVKATRILKKNLSSIDLMVILFLFTMAK